MIKRSLFSIFLSIFIAFECGAIVSYPGSILQTDCNGNNVYIHLKGDENLKFGIVRENGLAVVNDSLGKWRYLDVDNDNNVVLSVYDVSNTDVYNVERLVKSDMLTNNIKNITSILKKNLPPLNAKINSTRINNQRVVGDRTALIILAQFPDKPLSKSPSDFNSLFNEKGYNLNNATGSVYDYFYEVSEGQLHINSQIIGPFTTKFNMAYYGANKGFGGADSNPFALFKEALNYAKNAVDLRDYDCNKDGYIDNIHIIYAGYGEEAGATSNAIWAHESSFQPISVSPELKIDRYSCSPELRDNSGNIITTIGPPCHEIFHSLGAMDYYDTNYETDGLYSGTGNWDIMASGSWNNGGATPAWPNPYVRAYNMGWKDPITLTADGYYDFEESNAKNIYRITNYDPDDFYLIELREGNYFSSAEPGHGLMVFHIGPDIENKAKSNTINSTFPQQCYPVCSTAQYKYPVANPISYGDINSAECPFTDIDGRNSFDENSTPAPYSIKGIKSEFALSNIGEEKSGTFSFYFSTSGMSATNSSRVILWQENFETKDSFSEWTQSNILGTSEWAVSTDLSAIGQNSYISLSPNKNTINPITISNTITSPYFIINAEEIQDNADYDEYILKFKVRNFSSDRAICVAELINDNNIIDYISLDLAPNKEWQDITTKIDYNIANGELLKIRLTVTYDISSASRVDIDEIQLIRTTTKQNSSLREPQPIEEDVQIYDINGIRLIGTKIEDLESGFYFVRSDSKVKKIFVR